MKTKLASSLFAVAVVCASAVSCTEKIAASGPPELPAEDQISATLSLRQVARMFASLPLGPEQLREVYDAVGASSGNGYDEEYTMTDLFVSPGRGVGDGTKATGAYSVSLRDMITSYLKDGSTRASGLTPEEYIAALSESDIQLYWPYSDSWDGSSFPIITFDPGYGSQYNTGFQLERLADGSLEVSEVYVDEYVAMERPVWVVNNNTDSGYPTLELLKSERSQPSAGPNVKKAGSRNLYLRRFNMLRNYDSWFGGASEFWIKCGSVSGFTASTEAELKLFSPTVTDFLVVVKRSSKGEWIDIDNILMSGFTNQMENLVFMISEDDGGTRTSWKCEATVKIKSRSYGFDVDLPYNRNDDIVWRGQLAASYFQSEDEVTGRFGDVEVIFALE